METSLLKYYFQNNDSQKPPHQVSHLKKILKEIWGKSKHLELLFLFF